MVAERAEREEIGAKLLQADPLFRLQIVIGRSSPERERTVACLQSLLAALTVRGSRPPALRLLNVSLVEHHLGL